MLWLALAFLAPMLTLVTVKDAAAGKIYHCVDDKNKKIVSDRPCEYSAPPGNVSDKDKDKDKAAPADAARKDGKTGSSAKDGKN